MFWNIDNYSSYKKFYIIIQLASKKTRDNFFYSILTSTLKKGERHKSFLQKISKLNSYQIKNPTSNPKSKKYRKVN